MVLQILLPSMVCVWINWGTTSLCARNLVSTMAMLGDGRMCKRWDTMGEK